MADQAIGELIRAEQIRAADLFLLEQNGDAKSLPGQVLLNWLTNAADGHGGIQSIVKVGSTGLADSYRITLADTTTVDYTVTNGKAITSVKQTSVSGLSRTYTIGFNDGTAQTFVVTDGRAITDVKQTSVSGLTRTYTISFNSGEPVTFAVTDGRAITGIAKKSTSGLVDTYEITYNDGPPDTFTVTNGAKGDKGDNAYTWIRYASQQPTENSHSMGTVPDDWMGIYNGPLSVAPGDWKLYSWFKVKGDKGNTGDPARLTGSSVTYLVSDRGDIVPSGSWGSTVPTVPQGKYLWTRTVLTFNSGSPVTYYSAARSGVDGTGAVSTVNGVDPDSNGNVKLTGADIPGASGQSLVSELDTKADKTTTITVTLTAAGWTANQQTVGADGVQLDGDVIVCPVPGSLADYLAAGIWCKSQQTGALIFGCKKVPGGDIAVSVKPM